jgi:hypothetical protein
VVQFLRADAAVVREEEVCVEKRSGFVVQACAEDFERRRGLSGLWLVSETGLGVNYSLSRHLQLFRMSEDCGRRHAHLHNLIQPI